MQWLKEDFLGYISEWEREINNLPGLKSKEKQKRCLSKETMQGINITGTVCVANHLKFIHWT